MDFINCTIKKRKKSKTHIVLDGIRTVKPLLHKIIFLDVDGVLNNLDSDPSQLYVMEPELLKLLHDLLDAVPECAIVLSSTWRLTPTSRAKVLEFFNRARLPTYISSTPNLGTNRVDEILCWLQDNTDFDEFGIQKLGLPTKLSKYEDGMLPLFFNLLRSFSELPLAEYLLPRIHITHFIAIDDMDLRKEPSKFTEYITPRFVHVDFKVCLAVRLLACLLVCLFVCLSVCLSVCLFVCLFVLFLLSLFTLRWDLLKQM
jgi:hypothetical protein